MITANGHLYWQPKHPELFLYKNWEKLLRPCYTVQFSQQVVLQWHCEVSYWRIAQCNMGCLAIVLLREALHEVELGSTFRNGLQQLTTPLHGVSTLQQLVSQFHGIFNKGVCARFLGALRDQLLRKLHSVTEPEPQTSATCNAKFSTIARQVSAKIA